ncbi:MAG: hypothetical protein JOZ18_23525 [Chloroflexi bacterium]|nr:hypothetical protein [Chloroflexota bacterium]
MSPKTLYQLSGLSLVLGALLLIIGLILNPVDTGVTTVKDPLIMTSSLLNFFGVLFTLLGLPGLFLRQSERAGLLGLLGMLLSFFATGVLDGTHTVISFAVLPVLATSPATAAQLGTLDTAIQQGLLGTLVAIGGPMILLGLLLLGIATLRARVFPRWVGIVLIVVVPIIPLSFVVPILSNAGLELPYFAFAAAGFVLLTARGFSQSRPAVQLEKAS